MRPWKWTAILALLGAPAAADGPPAAREVMERVEARDDGDRVSQDMEMILINRRGAVRHRVIRSFRRDHGPDRQSIMFFLEPADVKDTGFLTYDYDAPDADDDQWLYLPALKKTKRIAAGDKSRSFMGSDFSYADLTTPELDRYDYRMLDEDQVEGEPVWVIEAIPRVREEVERTGYTRSVLFVRQDNHVVVRAVNWLEGGDLKYMEVEELERIDGIWVPSRIRMSTRRGSETVHKTILRISNVQFERPLGDEHFSVRRLEKGL